MRKMLFRYSSKLMLEIVKERDLEKINSFFDYLNSTFSYDEAMSIIREVAQLIFNKNKELYDWLNEKIAEGAFSEFVEEEVYINIYDLIHILLDEGKLPGVDFIGHPFDPDRIMSTKETYFSLVDMFGEDCIDQMVEVGSVS